MSDDFTKAKRSKRLHKDEVAIQKQLKIAKRYKVDPKHAHGLAKKHFANCGNPNCVMCANPRKVFKEKTIQEVSFDQTKGWIEE